MQFTDTSEKGFQKLIVRHLTETHKFRESSPNDFDKEFCINTEQLFEFIKTTQPESYDMITAKGERSFLIQLDNRIKERGVIEVLRKGVKHFDKTIDLFYRQPSSNLNEEHRKRFESNIFSVTEELKYTSKNENRLDLTIFLNGIPVITMELKNPLSGQNVHHALRQYQEDRDPKDKIFTLARCLVHFAADTESVFMTTTLKGKNTTFFPYNKGLNDDRPFPPFGAENPVNPNGLRTHYLWEDILSKETLCNIIDKFAQKIEETDEDTGRKKQIMIFPRYHQLSSVRRILNHAKQNGVGHRYLIQHSAGSGKSNSIAWLATQLIGLHDKTGEENIFDSVIVVTDRTVLDRQIQETIKQFAQVKGTVEAITSVGGSKSQQLKEAIINKKKIIITTVQTFPHILKGVEELPTLNFGIIIDEAHSSQSGETSTKMNAVLSGKAIEDEDAEDPEEPTAEDKINELIESRKMIKNGSYFAFTATPKNKTLETFGTETLIDGKKNFFPFHLYSMKQAIDEGFILDVLENYTTYNSYYKLIKKAENNPQFDTKQAQKKLRVYVEGHEFAILEKSKIMIDHFNLEVKDLIKGEAKSMIVTKSIVSAIKYKLAFDKYLKEINSPFKAIVAFSGKKTYKGIEYDEVSMNNFPENKNDIPKNFKKNEYKFLIVANKYQTGFDQPLLHTMYVDKKLSDVQAVQTLSRLNRQYKPFKKDTFVLDFFNSAEDIKEAFKPYYTTTILDEETNPNKLNNLQDDLDRFEIYLPVQVEQFFIQLSNNAERIHLDPLLDATVHQFKHDLNLDKQIDFKVKAKSFLRTYSYLARILDFNNHYWEQLWWFLKNLVPKLVINQDDDLSKGILEAVDMDSYRPSKLETKKINLGDDIGVVAPIPVDVRGGKPEPELDTLENIVSAFNKRFGDIDWSDKDKVNKFLLEQLPADIKADKNVMESISVSKDNHDRQNAKITSDKKIDEVMQQYLFTQTEIYKKFSQDKDFQRRYKEFIFDMLWEKNKDSNINP
jgi:type I restriction enzyme, R subunit